MKKKEENQSVVVIAITILQTFTPLFLPHTPLYFYTQSIKKIIGVKRQREMYLLRRRRRLKTLIDDESNDEEHKRTRSRQLRRR
jgi:hypothetical protein